ncbi:MAG: hypothetical protein J6A29_02395 [Clostridia bacterium]|nr:hypothetical protein [Clostridia bacterium]
MYVKHEDLIGPTKSPNSKNTLASAVTSSAASSAASAAALAAAIAEENRRKKIQEYKKLMNDVAKATSKISKCIDELVSIETTLDKCITGELANSIKNMMQNMQGQTEKVMNDLNVIGTKAAQKVENEGEPCTYDKQQPNSNPSYNGKGKTTFSCNTDLLRKQLSNLQAFNRNVEKTTPSIVQLSRLEGCEDVTNIPNQLNIISKLASNAYKAIASMIERAEQAEAETKRMAEQLVSKNMAALNGAARSQVRMNKTVRTNRSQVRMNKTASTKDSLMKKFSEAITYTIEEVENLTGNIKEYYVTRPSTVNENNKPENVIIFLHGAYTKAPERISEIIINDTEVPKKPNDIIIVEPILANGSRNDWLNGNTVVQLKGIIDTVYAEYDLSREDTTCTIIRI